MKIAVPYENGYIFSHFGKSKQFKIYETTGTHIQSHCVVETQGNGHGALGSFLKNLGVQMVLCGGIGDGARITLMTNNISLFSGVEGDADVQVQALLKGELQLKPQESSCGHGGCRHSGGCAGGCR
jgi:predicted Fe-Mo cluster-binding NifX family protein